MLRRLGLRTLTLASLAAGGLLLAFSSRAIAQVRLPDGFSDHLVIGGLDYPVGMAFLPDGRLLVVEQGSSQVVLIAPAPVPPEAIGVIPEVSHSGGERGLLGITVDPRWPSKPYIYTHSTSLNPGAVRISRFTLTGDLAATGDGQLTLDPASRYDLIDDIPDAAPRHNGGTVRFGPDGMLYASLGEDANACAAQDVSGLRGVVLRLDVSSLPDGPGGPPSRALITPADNPFVTSPSLDARLVWAYGLRNPFRFHIDPQSGAVFIGDVGESRWEEIDVAVRSGLDFGWPIEEGPVNGPGFGSCAPPGPLEAPAFSLNRTGLENAAIISGGVYRSPGGATDAFPDGYVGDYFFGEYYSGSLYRLKWNGARWVLALPVAGQPGAAWAEGMQLVSDYLVGPDGALWYCRQAVSFQPRTGQIRRIAGSTAVVDTPTTRLELADPYPLPGPGYVHFVYTLAANARVALAFYDVRGRLVRRLVHPETLDAGIHLDTWNGRDDDGAQVPPGIYFARFSVNGTPTVRRIPLIR